MFAIFILLLDTFHSFLYWRCHLEINKKKNKKKTFMYNKHIQFHHQDIHNVASLYTFTIILVQFWGSGGGIAMYLTSPKTKNTAQTKLQSTKWDFYFVLYIVTPFDLSKIIMFFIWFPFFLLLSLYFCFNFKTRIGTEFK